MDHFFFFFPSVSQINIIFRERQYGWLFLRILRRFGTFFVEVFLFIFFQSSAVVLFRFWFFVWRFSFCCSFIHVSPKALAKWSSTDEQKKKKRGGNQFYKIIRSSYPTFWCVRSFVFENFKSMANRWGES